MSKDEIVPDKKLPKYLTTRSFKVHIVDWSDDTIRRRINEEGLPATRDGRQFIFETQAVLEWFKRRQVRAG